MNIILFLHKHYLREDPISVIVGQNFVTCFHVSNMSVESLQL